MDADGKGLMITSICNHAFRLADLAQLKVLIILENEDGERFWSANGGLREEFVNEGKVENRFWGIFEVKVSDRPVGHHED